MKFDHRFVLTDSAPSMRAYHADGVTMRLVFFNNILRVALLRDASALLPTWSVCPGEEDCPLEGRDKLSAEGFEAQTPDVEETEESLHFSLGGVDFTVEKKNFRIIARREKGILYADRSGLAYNFDGELGDGSIHYTCREAGERIFGLGDKSGAVNKAGRSFALAALHPPGGGGADLRSGRQERRGEQSRAQLCPCCRGFDGLFRSDKRPALQAASLLYLREQCGILRSFL